MDLLWTLGSEALASTLGIDSDSWWQGPTKAARATCYGWHVERRLQPPVLSLRSNSEVNAPAAKMRYLGPDRDRPLTDSVRHLMKAPDPAAVSAV